MNCLKNVLLNKPVMCGASMAEARAAVDSLTQEERVELAAMLRERYPERFGP